MKTRKTLLKCCAISFAAFLLVGCKKKAEGAVGFAPQRLQVSDNWPAGTGSAHVQYQSNAKVMSDFEEMNEAYAESLGAHRPARTVIGVNELPKPGVLLTMNLTATVRE